MKIKDAEDFYKTNSMQYDFKRREKFKCWYKKAYEKIGSSYLDIDGLNKLVSKLVLWYEFKFPEKELEKPGCTDMRFEHTEDISKFMNSDQLRYRLTHQERETLDCNYRGSNGYLGSDGDLYIGVNISKNGFDICDISINLNGRLSFGTKIKYNIPVDTIEDLYVALSTIDGYDLKDMKRCIDLHQNDLILRNYIVDAVRNGLLYSQNSTPEHGKIRMDRFTEDMFLLYPNIELDAKCNKHRIPKKNDSVVIKGKILIKELLRRGKNEESCNIRKY